MKRTLMAVFAPLLLAAVLSSPAWAQPQQGNVKIGGQARKGQRCIAKTSDGDQCKRTAQQGSQYCWQHDPTRKAKKKQSNK